MRFELTIPYRFFNCSCTSNATADGIATSGIIYDAWTGKEIAL